MSSLTRAIFDAVGISVEVEEKLMELTVTGLSGSGFRLLFSFIIEALIDAGLKKRDCHVI